MFQALYAIAINCAVFAATGLGPLAVLAPEAGPLTVLALAPAAGYALVSVALTFALLGGGTVASIMLPLTAGLLAVSLGCLLAAHRGLRSRLAGLKARRALPALAGLVLCLGLVTAPLATGNRGYAVFRGNASDSFIYLYLAKYLDAHPRDWAFAHSPAQIEAADPLLGPAPDMLNIRWTAGAMLAYCARITGQGILDFQYAFTLLSLVIFYAAMLPFLSAMGLSPFFCVLAALALSTGFYAQFILDLRAVSQLATLPLAVLLAWGASRREPSGKKAAACRVAFLALAYLACFINYTEIFPMLAGAVAVFVLLKAMTGRLTLREAGLNLAGFLCGLAAAWPARFLFWHMESQIHFTSLAPQLWSEAYFRWLFDDLPAGMFGLSLARDVFSAVPSLSFLNLPPVLVTTFGCAMGLCFLVGALRSLTDRDHDAPLAALAFSGASLAAFLLFLLLGKDWVAGKGLSYFAPFIAAMALYAVLAPGNRPLPRAAAVAGKGLAVLFLAWQLAFAGLRPVYAALDKDYPRYVLNHGSYHSMDCELAPIRAALRHADARQLAICSTDPWKWSFLGLSLSGTYDVRLPAQLAEGPATDAVFVALDRPATGAPPELAPYFAAENASFVLYRLPRGVLADLAPGLSCQTNPY